MSIFIDKKKHVCSKQQKKYFPALNVMYGKRYIAQLLQYLISVKYRVFLKLYYSCKICFLKY